VATIGFGGPAAKYAIIVHEDLNAHHVTGSAKYLEIPFKQAVKGMAKRIADGMRADLKTPGKS
jgi:hypothetical protein